MNLLILEELKKAIEVILNLLLFFQLKELDKPAEVIIIAEVSMVPIEMSLPSDGSAATAKASTPTTTTNYKASTPTAAPASMPIVLMIVESSLKLEQIWLEGFFGHNLSDLTLTGGHFLSTAETAAQRERRFGVV